MINIAKIARDWLGPFKTLAQYRGILILLIKRDFSVRTSGTVLGSIWMLLQPTLQVLAFWFLLDVILRVRFPSHGRFLDYFLIGMLPWLMISGVLQRNLNVLTEFQSLYQRSNFPVAILPFVPLCVSGITYGCVYLVVVLILAGIDAMLLAAVLIPGLILWLIPFSYILAVIGLFIRDSRHVVPFFLTMTMYMTPILWSPLMLPEKVRWLLAFNPIADIMAVFHGVLQGMPLAPGNVLRPLLLSLALLGPGWWLFHRAEPHVREAL